MSHELRTPLNAIIGFSEMLTKEDSLMIDAERRHEYAHLINEFGHHLLSVVNGILDMSKIETGNFEITPEPFAPRAGDRGLLRHAGAQGARAGIELVVRAARRSAGDRRRQARAQPDHAQSDVERDQVHRPRRQGHRQRARPKAAGIAVTVEDTGVGIGADDLPRIGDPFFQARSSYDRRHDGTGLGLSIVKGLLALHGGDLEIASRLGEGTASPSACRSIAKPHREARARHVQSASAARGVPARRRTAR